MKLIAVLAVLIIVVASLLADYEWRKWLSARRRDREGAPRDKR
jgi:hypothetical protein